MAIPDTPDRVPEHTEARVNARIRRGAEARILWLSRNPAHIDARLRELDREWTTERLLETNAAALALFGTLMAVFGRRRWSILPLAVTGFLLQHGVQGWCPPLPVIRRLGVRTPQEIEAERHALLRIRDNRAAPRRAARRALRAYRTAAA